MITFNVYQNLDEVNANSLLFESGEEIASLQVGKYYLSLMCRGEVRLVWKNEVYKGVSQFPQELKECILKGNLYENDDLLIDENNWFQFELLKKLDKDTTIINGYDYVERVNDYLDTADIEGTLEDEENSKSVMLYKIMVDYLKELKNQFSDELKDLDLSNL